MTFVRVLPPPPPSEREVTITLPLTDANLLRSFLGQTAGEGLYDLYDKLDDALEAEGVRKLIATTALNCVLGMGRTIMRSA